MRQNKGVTLAQNQTGYQARCWVNRIKGEIMPTNWKHQALHLAGPIVMTKRLINRAKRREFVRKTYNDLLAFAARQKAVAANA